MIRLGVEFWRLGAKSNASARRVIAGSTLVVLLPAYLVGMPGMPGVHLTIDEDARLDIWRGPPGDSAGERQTYLAAATNVCVEHAKSTVRNLTEYFWAALRNAKAKYCRGKRRASSSQVPEVETCPLFSHSVEARLVRKAVGRLPERQQLVLYLRHVEGYSHAEIAERIGISLENSQQLGSRGKKALEVALFTD